VSDILDGFLQGLLLSVVIVQFLIILFLYFGIPSIVMDILDAYLPGVRTSRGGKASEGIAGMVKNPLISTGIELLRGSPANATVDTSGPSGRASPGGLLRDYLRR